MSIYKYYNMQRNNMLNEGSLGTKRAYRRLKALEKAKGAAANILGFNIEKSKMKSLHRAVEADMDRKSSNKVKALNLAQNIENLRKEQGISKSKKFGGITDPSKWFSDRSGIFAPSKNVTKRIKSVVTAMGDLDRFGPIAAREYRADPRRYYKTFSFQKMLDAQSAIKAEKLGALGRPKEILMGPGAPGDITIKNIASMIGRIERSRAAGALTRMGYKGSSLPQYSGGDVMRDIEQIQPRRDKRRGGNEPLLEEKDVKGQMHFDFTGAENARKEEEAKRRAQEIDDKREENRSTYQFKRPTAAQISRLVDRRRGKK